MDSPALSVLSDLSDLSDDELDQYFASYVPLSNLPTPPPSKGSPKVERLPVPAVQQPSPELDAYATHLANLVPRNVSTQRPSVTTIRGFLERANLPPDMVAFAACILDALSQRFAASWRASCLPPHHASSAPRLWIHARQPPAVGPELIVLSALALAHGFLEDGGRSNSHWEKVESIFLFTAKQIDATKTCILQDMDYGLCRITEAMVQRMGRDMRRAGNALSSAVTAASKTTTTTTTTAAAVALEERERDERRPKLWLHLPGTAMWANGMQTPGPSP